MTPVIDNTVNASILYPTKALRVLCTFAAFWKHKDRRHFSLTAESYRKVARLLLILLS